MTTRDDATDLAPRLIGGVWGILVGDAVGVPYEFRAAAQIGEVQFGASGTHKQPPGTWSDDGALILALLDALLEDEPGPKETRVTARFDPEAQGRRIVAWRRDKAYTPDGDGLFDIGNATGAAIHALEAGTPAEMAGGIDERSCGNGSLMRILPVALVNHDLPDADLADMAHRASSLTHRHPRAQVACALYVLIAKRLLAGDEPASALASARESLRALYAGAADAPADADRLAALDHLEAYPDRAGRGRVWDSFWSAWDATKSVTTALFLQGYRPTGSATVSARITGTRSVVITPVADSSCVREEVIYTAIGEPTKFAALATPRPTPRATPRPTARPATGGSTGNAGTGWTQAARRTAIRYRDGVQSTYRQVYATASELWGYALDVPGLTSEEVAARKAEVRIVRAPGIKALKRHLSFMANNPAPPCLRDAYKVDKAIARSWLAKFESYDYPHDITGQGRAAAYEWQELLAKTDRFLSKQGAYFRDCG